MKANSLLILPDTTILYSEDTTITICDSLNYYLSNDLGNGSRNFFSKLEDFSKKKHFLSQLFSSLIHFPKPKKDKVVTKMEESEKPYRQWEGYEIAEVNYKRVDVFGASVDDTTKVSENKWVNIANNTHMHTVTWAIKKNIYLKPGDKIRPEAISDNERVVRSLPNVRDAKIYVRPLDSADSLVALDVVTQDNFPIFFSGSLSGLNRGAVGFVHKNFLGMGHEFGASMIVNSQEKQQFGYDIEYLVPNIRRSFINASVGLTDVYDEKSFRAGVYRDFYHPSVKYAGGAFYSLGRKRLDRVVPLVDLDAQEIPWFDQQLQDYWFARSFPIKDFNPQCDLQRFRFVVAARYIQDDIYTDNNIMMDTIPSLKSRKMVMGSIGLSSRRYFKDKFIFSFGKNEDIPHGERFELTYGKEFIENGVRDYFGLRMAKGNFVKRFGYLQGQLDFSGFFRDRHIEEGMISGKFSYFSHLFSKHHLKIRQFINLRYAVGINRLPDEYLELSSDRGIRGVNDQDIRGNQMLVANFETVKFTALQPMGFRLAVFFFTDIGLLSDRNKSLFKGSGYAGFGLGIRARNDHLVFKTIQLRLGYYPVLPDRYHHVAFDLAGQGVLQVDDFDIGRPEVLPFR
ncbi:hypothetical protein [Aureibacter tunicatorum]|uniref:Bacterial surface antigen (D15) domain-containing protein n=1 Tax=Aureibacter tunicatorum TaxID=866807 RepID=A0AAE3XNL2_9BACT|nr:hypothetical protein [Aureibacter tunicatorum]MDR6239795.1 hypothetical protein [Aureibacter tunicatorum]